MASPVNDSYTVNSGATLYAGMSSSSNTINLSASNCTQVNSSSSGSVTVGSSSEPTWRQGLAVNQWVQISGSAMSSTPPTVNPGGSYGESARMDAWCGFCIDTRSSTVWSLANGGHTDYYGNEVLKFDLSANSPTWVEVRASDSAGAVTSNSTHYTTGRPASSHTYYTKTFIEARNRAMRFGVGAVATSGNPHKAVDGFDCTVAQGVNGWDAAGTYPSLPGSGTMYSGEAICKNTNTEDVYFFYNNQTVWRWNQTSNTWTQINNGWPDIAPVDTAVAFDSNRNRVFLLRPDTGNHHTFDPATGLFTSRTLTGTVSAINAANVGIGMIYEPTLDAYLVRLRAAGGTVYSINASTFAVTAMTTTGGTTIPATANISGTPENVYTRFLYCPELSGVVYFPHYSANAWFLRTH